jgi:hypothetical protein
VISNNTAWGTAGASGGGICNETGTVTITGSTVAENLASAPANPAYGGGIFNGNSAFLTLTQSTVSKNTVSGKDVMGGGIHNESGKLTVDKGTISDNTASGTEYAYSGGVSSYGVTATVAVTHAIVSRNVAVVGTPGGGGYGGGFSNTHGTMTMTQCTISRNSAVTMNGQGVGGGIFSQAGSGIVTVSGGTVSENYTLGTISLGGGIANAATLVVGDSAKIIQNLSSGDTGGIYNDAGGTATISSNTVITGNMPNDKNF